MTTRRKVTVMVLSLALVCAASSLLAQKVWAADPPLAFPANDVSLRIVGATFVTKLEGMTNRFEESEPDEYRGLVLTVEVRKPAGEEVTFIGQDFTLHYRYGDSSDVSPCNGLSTFSAEKDVDRQMKLFRRVGRVTTGLSTTQAEIVYVDMFFQYMEAETSDLYLFVAQDSGASFRTSGWK
jgi:hypothetical protein